MRKEDEIFRINMQRSFRGREEYKLFSLITHNDMWCREICETSRKFIISWYWFEWERVGGDVWHEISRKKRDFSKKHLKINNSCSLQLRNLRHPLSTLINKFIYRLGNSFGNSRRVINRWSTNRIMSNKPFNFHVEARKLSHTHTHIEYIHGAFYVSIFDFNWNECLFARSMQALHVVTSLLPPPPHLLLSMCDDNLQSEIYSFFFASTTTFIITHTHTQIYVINKLSLISNASHVVAMISHFTSNLLYLMELTMSREF